MRSSLNLSHKNLFSTENCKNISSETLFHRKGPLVIRSLNASSFSGDKLACNVFLIMNTHSRTPRHSVSSVLVLHIRAVQSSEPVMSREPSSLRAIQLMAPSWSAEPAHGGSAPTLARNKPVRPFGYTAVLFLLLSCEMCKAYLA